VFASSACSISVHSVHSVQGVHAAYCVLELHLVQAVQPADCVHVGHTLNLPLTDTLTQTEPLHQP